MEHIARHQVNPAQAEQAVCNRPIGIAQAWRHREPRTVTVGPTGSGNMLTVVWTWRRERIRVVTARPSSREEREFYVQEMEGHRAEEE